MMKTWDWVMAALCALWLLGWVIVVSGPSGGLISIITNDATPGWAGFFGGALAVFAAYHIAHQETARRRALVHRSALSALEAVRFALEMIPDDPVQAQRIQDFGWNEAAWASALRDLQTVPKFELSPDQQQSIDQVAIVFSDACNHLKGQESSALSAVALCKKFILREIAAFSAER